MNTSHWDSVVKHQATAWLAWLCDCAVTHAWLKKAVASFRFCPTDAAVRARASWFFRCKEQGRVIRFLAARDFDQIPRWYSIMSSHALLHQADKIHKCLLPSFFVYGHPHLHATNHVGPTNRLFSMPHFVIPMRYIQISNGLVVMTFRTFSFEYPL